MPTHQQPQPEQEASPTANTARQNGSANGNVVLPNGSSAAHAPAKPTTATPSRDPESQPTCVELMFNGTPDELKQKPPSPRQRLRNKQTAEQTERMNRAVNRIGTTVIPALIFALFAWAAWSMIHLVAVNYCINAQSAPGQQDPSVPQRRGGGIAIIVITAILLVLVLVYYVRTLIAVRNPGLVPLPHVDAESGARLPQQPIAEVTAADGTTYLDRGAILRSEKPGPGGMEQFYTRDVFECDYDGLPRYCPKCKTWKPDRTNHCSELERCVFKMDHFCPWASGVVTEASFKFFIQFCGVAALFCLFCVIVSAWYTAVVNIETDNSNAYARNVYALIALAFFFSIFSGGICGQSIKFALRNVTMVDTLQRKGRILYFAVRITEQELHQYTHLLRLSYPLESSPGPRHHFMIVELPLGANPYDMGSHLQNFQSVMGDGVWSWLSPVSRSPCSLHSASSGDGQQSRIMYPLGPAFHEAVSAARCAAPAS